MGGAPGANRIMRVTRCVALASRAFKSQHHSEKIAHDKTGTHQSASDLLATPVATRLSINLSFLSTVKVESIFKWFPKKKQSSP